MPLARVQCEVDPGDILLPKDCIACAEGTARHERRCQFTGSLLRALYDKSGREQAGLSVTMLVGCLRQSALTQLLPYVDRPGRRWPALRGTLFHLLPERHHAPHLIVETRFRKEYAPGCWITGKMDEIDPRRQLLVDYKTVERFPDPDEVRLGGRKESWVLQTNAYRWLLRGGERLDTGEVVSIEIERLGIVALGMQETRKYTVPLLPLPWIEQWILERASLIERALLAGRHQERTPRSLAAALPPIERPGYDPLASPFCRGWCPVRDACQRLEQLLEHDDDADDALDSLKELR